MTSILDIPEAAVCRDAYLANGAQVNTPDGLAAEVRWLEAVLPTCAAEDPSPVLLRDLRLTLRGWLHETGPRPTVKAQAADREWLEGVLRTISRSVGAMAAVCHCDQCSCENVDTCAAAGSDEYGCECCGYQCSGYACEDHYCRGCEVCCPVVPPVVLAGWVAESVEMLRTTGERVLAGCASGHVVGRDDHLVLPPLPVEVVEDELSVVGAFVRGVVVESLESGVVRGKQISVSRQSPAVGRMRVFLDRQLSSNSTSRARGLVTSGLVSGLERHLRGDTVVYEVRVEGTEGKYVTSVRFPRSADVTAGRNLSAVTPSCTCPVSRRSATWCKHTGALLYLIAD